MKKCANCGSISKDEDHACGVCGVGLGGTPTISLEEAEHARTPRSVVKRPSRVPAIVLLVGTVLVVIGAIGLFVFGPWDLFVLLIGLLIAFIGILIIGGKVLRPLRGRGVFFENPDAAP